MTSPYRLSVATSAAEAAVPLSYIKAHCRVDISDDDILLTGMAAAATSAAEKYLRRAFVSTQFSMKMDSFSESIFGQNGIIYLPRADVISVDSIKYLDSNGVEQTLSPSMYAYGVGENSRLTPAYGKSFPSHRVFYDSVKITFTCGYGDSSDSVPAEAKLAIAHIVDHWYWNRSSVEPGAFQPVPQSGYNLLDTLSWGRW